MSRHQGHLVGLIAVALLLAAVVPATPEEVLATNAPNRVEFDDGRGTVILTRGDAASNAVAPRIRGDVSEIHGYVPADDAAVSEFQSPLPGGRLLLDFGARLQPLDRSMGRVIGKDDRRRVRKTKAYPARTATFILVDTGEIGAKEVPEASLCSGAMVGAANLVITAAHCVHDYEAGSWFDDWTIYPGAKSANVNPYGSCGWSRVYVHKKWQRTGKPEFDVAAIVLDCNVGDRTGWLGARAATGSGYLAGTHVIHQYPGDKPLATQWRDQGSWVSVNAAKRRAFYEIDTAGGSSGSAVIQKQPDGTYNTNATHAYGSEFNSGALWWKQPWKKVLLKAFNWATRAPQ